MPQAQAGILAPVPCAARYLFLELAQAAAAPACLAALAAEADGERVVVGLGAELVAALGKTVPGLEVFPARSGVGVHTPSTPAALMLWLRGDAPGELLTLGHRLAALLAPAFRVVSELGAFKHQEGRDLTGYEDGTENPVDDAAEAAALLADAGPGLDGSSFVAVQQWLHDFSAFSAMAPEAQDHCIGRRRSDNEELDEAPVCAHVKRSAQESFEPEAFMLRRSMPWTEGARAGLMFVAFGHSFAAFDAVMQRMLGLEDGVTDALFTFTKPLTGAYFWCPPMGAKSLDLSAIGL